MPLSKTHARLKSVREAKGLSAAHLAKSVNVSRQTIYAIEEGTFVPNTAIALRLARVLRVSVEDLFSLDQQQKREKVKADLLVTPGQRLRDGQPVRLCHVNGRLLAIPASFPPAFLPPAEGIASKVTATRASVDAITDLGDSKQRLLIAGCDPALSMLSEALGESGFDIICVPCSSSLALRWLKQRAVHVAGSHLRDSSSDEYNLPFIKRLFPNRAPRVITFARWEQGLVLAAGNPKRIRCVADLADKRAILINREKGSGSRDLLDASLRSAGILAKAIIGYHRIANGHLAGAYAVASGSADCCIANKCAARCFGLDFIPITVERFDLSFSQESIDMPSVKVLLNALNSSNLGRKLEALAGHDSADTGKVLA